MKISGMIRPFRRKRNSGCIVTSGRLVACLNVSDATVLHRRKYFGSQKDVLLIDTAEGLSGTGPIKNSVLENHAFRKPM
jgi:hypothetical protein